MRRSLWIVLAVVVVAVLAASTFTTRAAPTRVLARNERIKVMQSTGQWYHDYSVTLGIVDSSANGLRIADTLSLVVGKSQFDATRIGARSRVKRAAFWPQLAWVSDTASAWQTLARFAQARVKSYERPSSISPLDVQTAGLARVTAVHSVQRRTFFWQKNEKASSDRSRWIHLVEVEFWAQRPRNTVRTIDVIDAGSIPGLHAGDIVQMHYDQRDPRVMRLDDGMRTFAAGAR